jgi:hypothetical protein
MNENSVPFGDLLSEIYAAELSAARGNPERVGEMVERLLNSLAFTIAIAAGGDTEGMSTMLQGAENYLYEAAASHQKVAQSLEGLKRS